MESDTTRHRHAIILTPRSLQIGALMATLLAALAPPQQTTAQQRGLYLSLGQQAFEEGLETIPAQVERELKGGNVQFTTLFRLDEDRSTVTHPVWDRTGDLTRKRR